MCTHAFSAPASSIKAIEIYLRFARRSSVDVEDKTGSCALCLAGEREPRLIIHRGPFKAAGVAGETKNDAHKRMKRGKSGRTDGRGKKDADSKEGNTASNIKARGLGTLMASATGPACVGLSRSPLPSSARDTQQYTQALISRRATSSSTPTAHQPRFVPLSARFVFRRGLMRPRTRSPQIEGL